MAEETQPKPAETAPTADVAAVSEAKPEEEATKPTEEPAPVPAEEENKPTTEEAAEAAAEAVAAEAGVTQSVSFKEESNVVADLEDPEKKALDELKQLLQAALANKEFTPPPPPPPPPPAAEEKKPEESKAEEKTEEKTEEAKTEEASVSAPAADAPEPEEPAQPAEEPPAGEEPAPPADGVPKPVDPKLEEPKPVEPVPPVEEPLTGEEPAPSEGEEPKQVDPKMEEPKPVDPAPPADEPPPAAEEKITEKSIVVGEDGAKTVEAIEETVVPVNPATEEPPPPAAAAEAEAAAEPPEEVFIWGVPLLGDEKSDTVLLKFLRARDFKPKDALAMIKNAVIWRKKFGIDSLVEEEIEIPGIDKVVFNHGLDKEGHPVCYNVYGEFQDKELYAKAFGDEENREKFLRWRIQFLERSIRQQLDFSPGEVCTIVQVNDLKNTVGPGKKELRGATKKALTLLQDNYPEFVAKQVFINVPWWYLAYNRVISPFFTQRTKSKFVFAGSSKSAETLFKYIAPEQVPVQYGGLSKENDPDFTTSDAVTEVTIKPSSKHTIEIPAAEGSVLVWELRVLGWEVSYGAEFVPTTEDGYTVIVQKARKFAPTDDPYVKNSFKIVEPGKVVLTIDNATSKKKKLLYRYKEKNSTEST